MRLGSSARGLMVRAGVGVRVSVVDEIAEEGYGVQVQVQVVE